MSHNTQVTNSTSDITSVLAGNNSNRKPNYVEKEKNILVEEVQDIGGNYVEEVFSVCAKFLAADYAVVDARRRVADDQSVAKNDSVQGSLTSGLAAANNIEQTYDQDAQMASQDAKTQISSAVMSGAQGLVGGAGLVGAVRANSVSTKMDDMADQLNKVNGKPTQLVLSDQDQTAVRPAINRVSEAGTNRATKADLGMKTSEIDAGMTIVEKGARMSVDEIRSGMTVAEKRGGLTLAEKQGGLTLKEKNSGVTLPMKQAKTRIIEKYSRLLKETRGGETAGIRSSHYKKIIGKDTDGNSGTDFNLSELEEGKEHGLAAGQKLPKVTLRDVFEAASTDDDSAALRAGIGRGQRNAMKGANQKNTNVQTAMQIANGVSGAASNAASAQFKMDSAKAAEAKGAAARDQALNQSAQQIAQDTARTQGDTISGANQDVQAAIRTIVEMGQPIHV